MVHANSPGLSLCPAARFRSTCRTTSASKPSPALKVKYRSPASPRPMVRYRPVSMTSLIRPIAAAGSTGSPSARANTLAPPPGITASSGPRPRLAGPDAGT